MKKVALLGARGYIARSIVPYFLAVPEKYELHLFTRDSNQVIARRGEWSYPASPLYVHSYDSLTSLDCDIIINATGIGDQVVAATNPSRILYATEEVDNQVLKKIASTSKIQYINISSGAVFGTNVHKPITRASQATFSPNSFNKRDYYAIAKLHAEAKHRAHQTLPIIDLRVFAFFSSEVDVRASFLMSEIAACLLAGKTFITPGNDIVRDYVTPPDLFYCLECLFSTSQNVSLDIYSQAPISKMMLLEQLQSEFGLQYEVTTKTATDVAATNVYFTEDRTAQTFGYEPRFSSWTGISNELRKIKN